MANISLKKLLTEAEDFKARSKETGKLVHFKSKDSYDAAIKAGSHEDPDTKQDSSKEEPVKGASMFGADYAKNRGGGVPKSDDVDISDYSTDGTSAVLYKGKKVGDYMYDDITDEFTLKTKDGIKAFDTHADMFKHIQKSKTTSTPTSVPKITLPIQKKIQNWTEKEKAFFDKNEGAPGSKMRRSLGQTLKDKAAGALKAVKKGLKHEVDEFKAAGSAVNKFFRGDEISEHESKAFKAVMFKVVTTAVFGAAFGGLSHGVAGFGKHVAMEFIPHVIGETILKGVGKAAIFADTEGEAETDANMIKFAELIANGIEKMKITPEMMEQMVDSYNEKKVNENTMKNISLKSLIEAEDFKARSKETGKLVHFKSKDSYDSALKAGTHEDPKAEKDKTPKASAKPNDMFGGDYAKDRGGDASKSKNVDYFAKIQKLFKDNPGLEKYTMDQWNKLSNAPNQPSANLTKDSKIVKVLSKKTGVNGRALISWTEQNGVDLEKIASDVESKKLNPMDFMTAVVGGTGNKYAKDIIAKYSQGGGAKTTSNASLDGQTDDELYDALYDMGYDFGELGSDDFDEEGFADAAMSLGYRYDDKNKVWNHRDVKDSGSTKSSSQLPNKASKLNYKHAEVLEKSVNAETGLNGYVDTDENTDAIMYNASKGMSPTYTLYFGGNSDYNKPDEFRVSLLPTYGNDPSNIGNKVDKTFVTGDAAMKFMVDVAKKYKKELEMDDDKNESMKLSSILPKKYTK